MSENFTVDQILAAGRSTIYDRAVEAKKAADKVEQARRQQEYDALHEWFEDFVRRELGANEDDLHSAEYSYEMHNDPRVRLAAKISDVHLRCFWGSQQAYEADEEPIFQAPKKNRATAAPGEWSRIRSLKDLGEKILDE